MVMMHPYNDHLPEYLHEFVLVWSENQRRVFREDENIKKAGGQAAYAARLCASAKFSGSDKTLCRSAPAIRSKTPFMVSWILVLGRWNFRVAFEAS